MQTVEQSRAEALEAYLPRTLIQCWRRYPRQPPVWGRWLTGSLMHCDISGFTAMSESLARLGKEGAELMAGVLNGFFDRMLGIAERWGGVQMKFGGDAMLLFFSGRQHAAHTAACGLEMQAAIAGFRRLVVGGQPHSLRMRAGIHSGRFFSASVGQRDGLLHYLLLGPDVNRTAGVEPAAQPGQVALSPQTAALLTPNCRLAAMPGGLWRLRALDPVCPPLSTSPTTAAPSTVLRRYLLPPLAAPLAEGRLPAFSGEHRRVTALFVNVVGAAHLLQSRGEGEALAQIDAYLNIVIDALERHGGFLAGSDLAQEGDKLIALFGAPVSCEREEASALRCAVDLETHLTASRLELRQRIGINSGFVFAGEIGSARRREYTVIGDSVNLAARLIAAAPLGQTLVSAATAERAGPEFVIRRLRPLRVKGKAAPVKVYRLEGAHLAAPQPPERAAPVLGREAELAALLALSRPAARGRRRWAHVSGEPGIGKSRLAAELAALLCAGGWRQLGAYCRAHTSRTPFAAWTEPLRALFGIAAKDSPQEAWKKLQAEVVRLSPELQPFAPLVAELLSLPAEEDPLLRSLDAKTRRQRLTGAIAQVLHAAARERPLIFLWEDAHWADGPSLELLAEVLARPDSRLLVCLTSRQEAPPAELAASHPALSLGLRELPPEAARRLVASAADLPPDQLDAVVAKAQGNPLFLQEMARSGALGGGSLPETINDVMMARLDRLPAEEKTVLRLASVIGPTFALPPLQALSVGRLEPPRLQQALAGLAQSGFTRAEPGDPPSYAFSHVLAQEVAYETLPYAQRRQLHRSIAAYIEQERAGHLESACELLLHHCERAADPAKTALYAAMSGDRAASVFANHEAIDYYQRSLAALQTAPGGTAGDRSLLLERMGDCQETAGRHREAADAFAQALGQWRSAPRRRRPRLLTWPTGNGAREAILCRKLAVSCERRSQYDQSLRWLDEALTLLPRRPARLRAQVCAAKSVSLFRKGLYREGIVWGRRALALARRSGDPREVAYARNMLANSYMEHGALRMAIRHLRPAVRLYHEIGDFPGQASANNNLGTCYQELGVLDGALYHYQVALETDQRVGDTVDAAVVQNNIGEVLLALGRLDEAMAHLQQVVRAHRAGADLAAVAGLAQVNLCRCRLAQGDLEAAESHLKRALRLLRAVGAQGLLTEARLQLAELRLAQHRPQEALRESRLALARARALDAHLLQARAHRMVGSALTALGDSQEARSQLLASVSLARRIGAGLEEARSLLAMARLALVPQATGHASGRGALRQAVAILARMGAGLDLMEAQRLESRLGQ